MTCSLGVATFPEAGKDWDALFKAADAALYSSKRGGRNRATAWMPTRDTAERRGEGRLVTLTALSSKRKAGGA